VFYLRYELILEYYLDVFRHHRVKCTSDAFLGLGNIALRPSILHLLHTESLNNQPTMPCHATFGLYSTPIYYYLVFHQFKNVVHVFFFVISSKRVVDYRLRIRKGCQTNQRVSFHFSSARFLSRLSRNNLRWKWLSSVL
jgi:hypothetical protein